MHSIILQAQASNPYISYLLFGGIIIVFYFFMIRPQQKKAKDQRKFTEETKKGDYVVTIGGIHGYIAEIEGDTIILEIEKGGRIRLSKSAISMESTKLAAAAKK